jgi:hypothetical protein
LGALHAVAVVFWFYAIAPVLVPVIAGLLLGGGLGARTTAQ